MILPQGWVEATIEDLASKDHRAITDGPFGSALKSEHYTSAGARVIRLNNIGSSGFIVNDAAFISPERFEALRAHEVKAGDLVTAALGEPLGRTCVVPNGIGRAIVKADCFRLRPSSYIDRQYLLALLNSPDARSSFAERGRGIGRVRINLKAFRLTTLPVAPVAEQRRIVAKLDTLATRLARARTELDRVLVLASGMRRSALDAAFNGTLTSDVRSDNDATKRIEMPDLDGQERGVWKSRSLPHQWRWVAFNAFLSDVTDSKRKIPENAYQVAGIYPVIDQGKRIVGGYTDRAELVHSAIILVV